MYLNQLEIRELLDNSFDEFADYINTLPDIRFTATPNGQWSAGQQLEHLVKSIRPISNVMGYPKFTLLYFGASSLPSRSYDQLSDSYRDLLSSGCKTIKEWKPGTTYPAQRAVLLGAFLSLRVKLQKQLMQWSETELDKYRLPHPLMGKLTMREMLYFVIYHTKHHLGKLKRQEPLGQSWENQLQQLIF
jgi:hypothetical protein